MAIIRFDIYTEVHKALRKRLYEIGARIQSNDFTELETTGKIIYDLSHVLELVAVHEMQEEKYIHPVLEGFEPELVIRLERDHKIIEINGDMIREITGELARLDGADDHIKAGIRLNHAFNEYLAYFLPHTNYEEAVTMTSLWRNLTDEEILGMLAEITGSKTPEEKVEDIMSIFAAANNQELAGLVGGLKSAPIPREEVDALLGMARKVIGEERWRIIERMQA